MKRGFVILGLGVVGAAIAYCCCYLAGTAASREWLRHQQPELAWLKHEFKLSDAEFARILELHQAYVPNCRERCARVEELNEKLTKAIGATTQLTPEIEQLLAERARTRADCQTEMLKHFFEVSRTMPPEQGKRYLEWARDNTCLREQAMDHGTDNHAATTKPAHHP